MLWHKNWLDTRWRFGIGLAVLTVLAVGVVLQYPTVRRLLPLASSVELSGPMGRLLSEAVEVQREFRGFVWWQWHRQNLAQAWTLLAVLLGSGGLLSRSTGGAALFTLSLPISRTRLLGVRTATSLAELLVLAFVPSLLIVGLSPAIDESYSVTDVVVHGVCLFVAGSLFFSLAMWLSTVFDDLWRPLLLTCLIAFCLALVEQVLGDAMPFGIFRVMTGALYFRLGQVPWLGLLTSALVSLAILWAATRSFVRRDF